MKAAERSRISVLVPSYNSASYLRQALTSALDQEPRPYEVVVQDGGSTDGTIGILQSFRDPVRWASEPDSGQSQALNRALARAGGEIVVWLNSDDILSPGAVAAATRAFSTDPSLTFVYGDFDRIDHTGKIIRHYKSSDYQWDRVFLHGCYIFSGSIFIRRQALLGIGGFDESLQGCMDLDLLLRLRDVGQSRHLGVTVSQFRTHGASKSATIGLVFLREAFRVRRRYMGRSVRRWVIALFVVALSVVMEVTAPLRFSSLWPRHGRSKTL